MNAEQSGADGDLLRSAHAWISVEDRPPNENRGRVLVTNNITARDAFGQMSHIWIVFPILSSEPEKFGKWTAFDEGDRRICCITHWMPLPNGAFSPNGAK